MRESPFPGLQLDENIPFQRKAWKAQQVAFIGLLGLIALAAAGLFGTGPLSRTVREEPGSKLRAQYERFARFQSPNAVKFELPAGAAKDGKVDLWLSREWVESVQIDSIAPEPEESSSGPEGYTYTFKIEDPDRASGIIFHTLPNHAGRLRARAALPDSSPLDFTQFVYP